MSSQTQNSEGHGEKNIQYFEGLFLGFIALLIFQKINFEDALWLESK